MNNNTIIGIDLGTTNSVASYLFENEPKTIKINNLKLLPSAVCFSSGRFIVGQTAKNLTIVEPENTCLSVKRKMGEEDTISIGPKQLRPEEVSSIILKKIKDEVIKQLKLDVEELRAVVTVPAYFTEKQRKATQKAAEMSGIKVERIINEPTAAALAFGLNKIEDEAFAIYDLGGGTFDISIVENNDGIIEVKASNGDSKLGGDDFDLLLSNLIWEKFAKKHKINEEPTSKIKARLLKIAEETKIKLSTHKEAIISENFFYKGKKKPIHLELIIQRTDLEKLIKPLIEKTISYIKLALADADINANELEGIILVGGSSKIPLVSEIIENELQKAPFLMELPDEAVSHGATIQGAIINKIDVDTILIDITPHSLGISTLENSPMELAMQNMLNKDKDEPTDEYIEKMIMGVIIPKNTPVPVKKTNRFNAVVPFQEAYQIEVYQGEHENPDKNHLIGESNFKIKKPVQFSEIDVTFELDINGILKMKAVETTTNEKIQATFKSSRGRKKLKSKLIEEIVSDTDSNKILITRTEKMINNKDIDKEDKKELSSLLEKYKNAVLNKVEENIKNQLEEDILDLLFYLEE